MKKQILGSLVILLVVGLCLGCSSAMSPYSPYYSPIDEAIKACSLGYTTELKSVVTVAYNNTEAKKADINFEAGMKEELNSQIMLFANNNANRNNKDLIDLIKKTQDCVINEIDKKRLKTRKDFIYECKEDLQKRVAGKNGNWPEVKDYSFVPNHSKNSETSIVMSAYIDYTGSKSYRGLFACEIKNNQYYDFTRFE
ncbi:MAG: hypothetical protein A2525_06435 [Sulfurimonas sp. RIFOXYD12_FULL_36_11]|uniref:hypothetical protein n=1 Tax=Sulfurimonas sp. RIFOXYB12_FULL_35_9 TaxID=1802256 RepID=UPI0008BE7A89|nr:hypothetical protein [Sulfurimonas sp. RIFOXYB12_FULL_35_9]MBS4068992.1 hypothetical protein [Sulfurimonas sp.]OHE03602.1 MAG: hypothetical protein A2345_10970 [Sulfurimonas sp. RIFOXYB12_FULL_35_9]OHE15579.1 MAG: hypothetical protein A2525_06435 [Sulfurimonas sp. RIFOXYD12_FULL_36_11]